MFGGMAIRRPVSCPRNFMYPAPHHQTDAAGLALPQPEEFYRSLIESLESVLATVDANGRLLYMNKIAPSLLGGSAEEMVGKTLFDLFPPAVAAQHIESVRKVPDGSAAAS
jgi:PAS domain-containing protein